MNNHGKLIPMSVPVFNYAVSFLLFTFLDKVILILVSSSCPKSLMCSTYAMVFIGTFLIILLDFFLLFQLVYL